MLFEKSFNKTTSQLFNPGHYYAADASMIVKTSEASEQEIGA
jgi:hypothetical protein